MPQFNTGNADWDQGLGQLSNMLFPDVSKIAQAGYYGAESRKARLEGDAMEAQKAALAQLYAPYPQRGRTGQVPGVMAPGNSFAVQPPQPQPQPPMSTYSDPNSVGQSSGAPLVPGQEQFPGGRPMPPYVPGTASKLVDTMTQGGIQPNSLGMGTPPPAASPAPGAGAPLTPMTTGSDGSIPPTDLASGKFASGSLTQSGGGIKYGGPAASDGSPAQVFDLHPIIAKAWAAGLRGEDLVNYAASVAGEVYQSGNLDQNSFSQILAQLGRTGLLSSQTQLAQQGIVTGEGARQYNETPQQIIRPDGSIGAVPHNQWYANPDKYDVLDPSAAGALATQNYGLKNVFRTGPDGKPDLTGTELVSGLDARRGHRMEAPSSFMPVGTLARDTPNAEEGAAQREYLLDQAVEKAYAPTPRQGVGDYSRQEPGALAPDAKRAVTDRANQIFLADPNLRTDQKNFPLAQDRAIASLQDEGRLPTAEMIAKARARGVMDIGGKKPFYGEDPALMTGADGKLKFKIDLIGPQPGQPQGQGGAAPPGGTGAASVFTLGRAPEGPTPGMLPPPQGGQAPASNMLPQPQGPIPLSRSGIPGPGFSPPRPPPSGPVGASGVGSGAVSVAKPGAQGAGSREGDISVTPQGVPLIMRNGALVPLSPAEMQRYRASQPQPQGGVAGQ